MDMALHHPLEVADAAAARSPMAQLYQMDTMRMLTEEAAVAAVEPLKPALAPNALRAENLDIVKHSAGMLILS